MLIIAYAPKKRKTGMPPGTPMFTGDRISLLTDTTCLKYNDDEIIELHNDDSLDWRTLPLNHGEQVHLAELSNFHVLFWSNEYCHSRVDGNLTDGWEI